MRLLNSLFRLRSAFAHPRERRPWAAVLTLASILTCGLGQARAGDPELLWRTLETEHFRITYHEPLGDAAQKLAVVSERAHALLSPQLGHAPRFRTEVLLTDDTDFSNGSATASPFPQVRLYLTSPDNRSELNDYDDWLLALFVHEYTHILHLDTVNGLPKWLNYLLGFSINTIYAPNQVQPRWFIEGLAVFEETERTTAGRLRSTLFDMYLRSHVLEGRFLRLDQVTHQTTLFPRGNVPYLYGSAFLRYIARRFGAELLSKVSHRYGGCYSPDCWVPWGMNRALLRFTPSSARDLYGYGVLYKDFQKDLEQRYRSQRQAIAASPLGLSPEQALSTWKASVDRPVVGAFGEEILWLESDPYRRPALMRHDRRSGKTSVELEIDGASGLALSADGQSAVMSRLNYFRQNFTYKDLVLYRRDRRTLVALTSGLRADNPAISPDGRHVAFEVNSVGTRRLGIMELPDTREPGSERRIDAAAVAVSEVWRGAAVAVSEVWRARAAMPVRFPLPQAAFTQVYTPAWSPDGRHVAFSYWQEGGYRDIVTLEVATGRLSYVTRDRALDLEPRYSPDGEFLYFVSDRSGVYNVYAHHLKTDTTWQVSNVVNGVFAPAAAADGTKLYCVGFVAEGYRIEVLPLDRSRFLLAPAAKSERPEAAELPAAAASRVPVEHYNPARTFFRSALSLLSLQLPISAPGPYGQTFGLQFSTSDLVGLHTLTLGLTLSSGRADATSFSARYTYGRLWNSLSLDLARGLSPRGGLVVDGHGRAYDEESISTAVSTSLPVLRDAARSATVSLSYRFSFSRSLSPFPTPAPGDSPPELPELGRFASLSMSFAYSDSRSFLYSVAPEAGRYLSVSTALSHQALGSQYLVYSLRVQAVQYIGIPWPFRWAKNHTLSISYVGGIGGGDLNRRGIYYIGGFAPGGDFLRALLLGQSSATANLRGYAPNVAFGDQFHLLSAEYHFPILWLQRGYETLPLFLWRLHGVVFSDAGAAFFGKLSKERIKASVGGEVRLDGLIGYYLPFTIQLGYAYGFMEGAENQVYFLLNNPL